MTLQEQLTAFRQKRNEIHARRLQLLEQAGEDGRTFDDEERSEDDSLDTEIKHIDDHIDRLVKVLGDESPKTEKIKTKGPTILVRSQDPDDKFQGQAFVRKVIAKTIAQMSGFEVRASEVAERRWGKTHPNLVKVIKAGVAAGTTDAANWAEELVQADNRYTGDFIEYLAGRTVFDRLPLREIPAHVTIKGQDGIATANWVGEGAAAPVSAQDFSTVSLTPLKVMAISVITKELITHSSPSAEMLVRDGLVEAIAQKVDTTFLGAVGASTGTPAGILNSVSPINSNGVTAAALRQDVYELYAVFLTNKNATGLQFVMTPSLAKAISLLNNALGQTEFPGLTAAGGTLLGDPVLTGDNVGSNDMILLKPSDIYRIGNTGIEVSLSMDATLEQDGAPQGDSGTPAAASATLMSMFQTESVAFKVVRPINWAKRRSHAAQFVTDAGYGVPDATTA